MGSDWAIKNATKLFIFIFIAGIIMQAFRQNNVKEQMKAQLPGFSIAGTETISVDFSSPAAAASSTEKVLNDIKKIFSIGIY